MSRPRKPRRSRAKAEQLRHEFSEEFLERYALEDVLGAGGTAVVYRATQLSLKRPVAIKVLDAVGFEESDALARFEEEAKIAARLEHVNLVALYEFGRDGNLAYMVYEFVEGVDLDRRIRKATRGPRQGMLVEEALKILADVARGLAYAHKMGVVHRDLKPANVLLEAGGMAKVADFGLARTLGEVRAVKTRTGVVVGTPECMAPEQARGREVGPATDVYALGVLFYWMLAGRPPFQGESAAEVMKLHLKGEPVPLETLRPNLPPGVYEVLGQMLRKKPEDRPAARDVERALRVADSYGEAARSQVQKALRTRPVQVVRTAPRRSSRLVPATIAATLLGAGLLWGLSGPGLPEEVEAGVGPRRLRVTWSGPRATLEYRLADASTDWFPVEPLKVEDRWEAEVEDLEQGERYAWRLAAGRETTLDRVVEVPRPARIHGPWPRYDARGQPLGWWLRVEGDAGLRLADGRLVEAGAARVEAPPGVYSFVYAGGLSEVGGTLPDPPGIEQAVNRLQEALRPMSVRRVVGAGIVRRGGRSPDAACRAEAEEVSQRLDGVRPAFEGYVSHLDLEDRYALYRSLSRAEAVDRALEAEGFPPAFAVRSFLDDCLEVRFVPRDDLERFGGIELVSRYARENIPYHRHKVPPRVALPEGKGAVDLTLVLRTVWAPFFLEVEVGERRIPLRPPLRELFFDGEIRLRLPEAWTEDLEAVRVHLEREDLPGRQGILDLPVYPLFDPESRPPNPERPPPARLFDQEAVRR